MISRSFLKSSLVYTVIGALPLASSLILLPFYANYLSTSDYGIFCLFVGFTALVQILANIAIDHYLVYHYYDSQDNHEKVKRLVGTSVGILLVWGIIITLIFSILGPQLFNFYTTHLTKEQAHISFFPFGFFCILTAFFNSFFKTCTSLLIAQQKPVQFFWFNVSNFILTIGISLGGLYLFPYSLTGPMYGRLLSGVVIFIIALISFLVHFGFVFDKSLLKSIYKYCYPLFFNFNVLWIIAYLSVFIINYYVSTDDVAIYNFIISATLLIEFMQSGLTSAIYPKVFTLWTREKSNSNSPEVNIYFNAYTGITLLVVPLFVFVIPLIVPLVVKNKSFYYGFTFLLLISVGFTFRGIQNMYYSSILYLKKTKKIAKINLYTLIFQIIVSTVLIMKFGLSGAFWAFLLVKPFQTLVYYFETKKMFRYNMNYKKQMIVPFVYTAFALVLFPFYFKYNIHVLNFIQLVFMWSITFLVYKNEIINFYKTLIQKNFSLK
ncbi:MAG: oligosaccharide flippase family protein [Bacteroidota bacterium]